MEANHSATYIENYLDCVENLPNDLQRNLSQMRELDVRYQENLRSLDSLHTSLSQYQNDAQAKRKIMYQIQRALLRSQELADDKLQLVQQIQDLIENKARQLDSDYHSIASVYCKEQENTEPISKLESSVERANKRARRQQGRSESSTKEDLILEKLEEKNYVPVGNKKAKKKKRKAKLEKEKEDSPIDQSIDPNEPVYCVCRQISFGEMICCDNDSCEYEWFHFSCVALSTKPKGKWFCPNCRGDRPNVMKPRTLS